MSRINKNGVRIYTIGEKIQYYTRRSSDMRLSKRERYLAELRVQSLKKKKGIHKMVFMEDSRFFRDSKRDGHNYLITEIDSADNIGANRISHCHESGDVKLNKSLDNRSWFQRKTLRIDRNGTRLNANDAYESNLRDLDPEDLENALKKRK